MPNLLSKWILPLVALLGLATLAPAQGETGYLGLRVRAVEGGARILAVAPGSPAEAAGLSEGDLIVAADGEPLADLPIQAITAKLKGPQGSWVKVGLVPFPGPAPQREVPVQRGPPSDGPEQVPVLVPGSERISNTWLGRLRRGEQPDLGPAASVNAEGRRGLVLALSRVSAPWWVSGGPTAAAARRAFWEAVGAHEGLRAQLQSWPPDERLAAARWLAPHLGSAPLALTLLKQPPAADPAQVAPLVALAEAVAAADPQRVAAATVSAEDLTGPGGWSASVGPSPTDFALMELAVDKAGQGPPEATLPSAARAHIESLGGSLPWAFSPPAEPFGRAPPPPAPDFALPRPDGGTLALASHPGPVVLSFWATWCGPCREELPALNALRAELVGEGLEIWAISLDDDPAVAGAWMAEAGLSLPVAMGDEALRQAYNIGPIPRTIVLTAEKSILRDHTGFSAGGFQRLSEDVRRLTRGQLEASQTLGHVQSGQVDLRLGPVGFQGEERPNALFTDGASRLWIADGERVVRVVAEGGDLVAEEGTAVPLAFPADRLAWGDVDGDGVDELLTAARGGQVARLSRPDGGALWTHRNHDEIRDVAFWRGADGALRVAVLRVGRTPTHAAGPGAKPPPAVVPAARIDLLVGGQIEGSLPLGGDALALASDGAGALVVVLREGDALQLSPQGTLTPVRSTPRPVRGAAWVDVDGDGASDPILTSGFAQDALQTRRPDGAHVYALTPGGALVGLTTAGQPRFRLRLQGRTEATAADIDGDSFTEIVVSVPGFGLASLMPAEPLTTP